MVSKTVTVAEMMMRSVVAQCNMKALCEEVGASRRRNRSRFQRGRMSFAASSTFSNESTCGIESWRGDEALLPVKVDGPVRVRGMAPSIGMEVETREGFCTFSPDKGLSWASIKYVSKIGRNGLGHSPSLLLPPLPCSASSLRSSIFNVPLGRLHCGAAVLSDVAQ